MKTDVASLAAGVADGQRAALGRALTLVESDRPAHLRLAMQLLRRLGTPEQRALRVGISGAPGVGKSTFIDALGRHLIGEGHRLAVLAVDPSSDRSGGSILGDKTRMSRLSRETSAFIRPSPSRGSLGGVARKSRESIQVCEAAGYDVVLVETVGVGQSETEVAQMVDTFVVLLLPNAGDDLQGIKRGIIELADLLVVNKADVDPTAAARAAEHYRSALRLLRPSHEAWRPEVLRASGLREEGLGELWQRVVAHRDALDAVGGIEARRAEQAVRWMWRLVESELMASLRSHPDVAARRAALEAQVRSGQTPATEAAQELLAAFSSS